MTAREEPTSRLTRLIETYGILVLLSVIWGIAFVAIKILEPMLYPANLALLRWLVASAGFLALTPFIGKMKTRFELKDLPRFLLVGFAEVVMYNLTLYYSESTVSAGLATLLVSLGPVFIVVLTAVFFQEKHGRQIFGAIALALVGAVILFLGTRETSGMGTPTGVLEGVGTAFAYALNAVFSKPMVQKYGAVPFTIWSGVIGTAMLLPLLSGSFIAQVSALPISGWLAILYLSLLSTVLGYMLFFTLLRKGAVTRVSVQLYLIPVVGVTAGTLILGESVTAFTLLGGAALLLSVALSTLNIPEKYYRMKTKLKIN